MFGASANQNDNNINNNTAAPLMTPITNGEHSRMRALSLRQSTKLVTIAFSIIIAFWCFSLLFYLFLAFFALEPRKVLIQPFSSFYFCLVHESQGFSKDICRSMVAMLDTDHSGKLGLEEFKVLINDIAKWKVSFSIILMSIFLSHKSTQAVFKLYDRDQTNKLNAYELREALASAGYHLNNHILNTLVYRYGSPDKTIAFDDYIMCAVKVKTMIEHFKEKDYNNSNQATFTMDEWITKALYS